MGPFELMDLVGVDTGFEVSQSFYEQSFGEPRWRPSMIAARYVAAGLHGRKSGRGYYDYRGGERANDGQDAGSPGHRHRPEDPAPLDAARPGHGEGVVVIAGEGALADQLRAGATDAGYEVRSPGAPTGGVLPALVIDCDGTAAGRNGGADPPPRHADRREAAAGQGGARLLLCARRIAERA